MDEAVLSNRNGLKWNLAKMCMAKEISWKQKFRERWLQEGDKNTKYFHAMASNKRRSNYIADIWFECVKVSGNRELREAASKYFAKLYEKEYERRPILGSLNFKGCPRVTELCWRMNFPKKKLKSLNMCNGDKASGPDGFNMKFLQKF